MKFLFVVPAENTYLGAAPFGIGIVATVAKQAGLDVEMLIGKTDENQDVFHQVMIDKIRNDNIDCIAIGGGATNYLTIKKIIGLANDEGCITVLGGAIVDPYPELIAENIGATYIVIGEGEITFRELAFALINGSDVSQVNGLIYFDGSIMVKTSQRHFIENLDTLPFVDDELTGIGESIKITKTLLLLGSRSCPFSCTFCYHLKGQTYRYRSLDSLLAELDYYTRKYGDCFTTLKLLDEMINADKDRILEFCRRVKPYNLKLWLQTRLDMVDEEILLACKDAGCVTMAYGIESVNDKVLKSMRKNTTKEMIYDVLALTLKCGIQVWGNLIVGDIEDDESTIAESISYHRKNAGIYDVFNIWPIRVYPGSYLYKYAIKNGIISNEITFLEAGCPFVNVSRLSDDAYALMVKQINLEQNNDKARYHSIVPHEKGSLRVHKNGSLDYIGRCSHCGSVIITTNIPRDTFSKKWPYQTGTFATCDVCGWSFSPYYIDLLVKTDISDMTSHFIESEFEKYIGSRIAIWGIKSPHIRQLIIDSQTLRDCLVAVVDSNFADLENEHYCGLSITHPKTLAKIAFDYLILGVRYRGRKSIENELFRMNITVPTIELFEKAWTVQTTEVRDVHKAILMAAGKGTRISRTIDDTCKCTLDIGGITLIRHTVEMLLKYDIEPHIVVGFNKWMIIKALDGLPVSYHENVFYSVTNSLASLWWAREELTGDSVILGNADVFWEDDVLDVLLNDKHDCVMLSDTSRVEQGDYLLNVQNGKITAFGKGIDCHKANCEYVGLARLQGDFIPECKQQLEHMVAAQRHGDWWEQVLYNMIAKRPIWSVDIAGHFWAEVDFIEDYNRILDYINRRVAQ